MILNQNLVKWYSMFFLDEHIFCLQGIISVEIISAANYSNVAVVCNENQKIH